MSHHTSDAECPLCEEKLKGAHAYMVDWFRAKKSKYLNLHISWAFRGKEDQEKFVAEGKSRAHYPNSAHNREINSKPESKALDLFLIDEDGVARFPPPIYAKINIENKEDRLPIKWGGDFKTLGDADHFELS